MYLLTQILLKPLRLPGRLISLKVDYADLKLDMSILLPAKLHILSEEHKFLFYDYDVAKQF